MPPRGSNVTGISSGVSHLVGSIADSVVHAFSAEVGVRQAAGEDVVRFDADEPDYPTDQAVVDSAVAACADLRMQTSTPIPGLPELRDAIAQKTHRDSGYKVDAKQVLITNGERQAIYQAFATLLNPGDEVILPVPHPTAYPEAISLARGVPVEVEGDDEAGHVATLQSIDAALTERTKVLVLSSPADPTGTVYSPGEIAEIGRWAVEQGIWIVADERYEHFVYGGAHHVSIPVKVPELSDQCIIINGVAATHAMSAWPVGWLIGPADVVEAAGRLQAHLTSNVCNIAQAAALTAVSGGLTAVEKMRATFDSRRLTMMDIFDEVPGVLQYEPRGAFYCYLSVQGLVDKRIRSNRPSSSFEVAKSILDDAQVALMPGEAFGKPGYLRLNYAMQDRNRMVAGLRRVTALLRLY